MCIGQKYLKPVSYVSFAHHVFANSPISQSLWKEHKGRPLFRLFSRAYSVLCTNFATHVERVLDRREGKFPPLQSQRARVNHDRHISMTAIFEVRCSSTPIPVVSRHLAEGFLSSLQCIDSLFWNLYIYVHGHVVLRSLHHHRHKRSPAGLRVELKQIQDPLLFKNALLQKPFPLPAIFRLHTRLASRNSSQRFFSRGACFDTEGGSVSSVDVDQTLTHFEPVICFLHTELNIKLGKPFPIPIFTY